SWPADDRQDGAELAVLRFAPPVPFEGSTEGLAPPLILDTGAPTSYFPRGFWHSPILSANGPSDNPIRQRLNHQAPLRTAYGQNQVPSPARPGGRETHRCRGKIEGRHHYSRYC